MDQAPKNGGPFILSFEKLPEIVASLNRVSRTCKLMANCFLGVGTVLITIKAIQGACRFLHRRKIRSAVFRQHLLLGAIPLHCHCYKEPFIVHGMAWADE